MGDTLSITFSDCFMNKLERCVLPLQPKFYRRFIDARAGGERKMNQRAIFKIRFEKFLVTKITRNKNKIKCFPHYKDNKLSFHWKYAMPKIYEKTDIVGDLHRANKISSNLEQEIFVIKAKYLKAGYPHAFINDVINNFHQVKEDFLIPSTLFEERKKMFSSTIL